MKVSNKLIRLFKNKGFYILLALGVGIVSITGYVSGLRNVGKYEMPEIGAFSDSEVSAPPPYVSVPAETTLPPAAPYGPAEVPVYAPTAVSAAVPEEDVWLILPVQGVLLSDYSGDELVYSKTMEDWRVHAGIDILGDAGTPVKAAAGGIVTHVFDDDMMGTTVIIQHADGIETVYCNLQTGQLVEIGQEVTRGEVVGGIGVSALGEIADPPHLHFEVKADGSNIDPFTLME